jgi:hypothetical protein
MDEPSPRIRLYIGEDVHESVAPALRHHGYDVLTVRETGRRGLTDAEQLAYAAEQGRTLFSFNASDYVGLHLSYLSQGREHAGIVVAKQASIGETVRRLLALLQEVSAEETRGQLRWLPLASA